MIENLNSVNVFSPSISEILTNILVSLVCGFTVSLIYRITYRGPGFSISFVNSITLLAVITTLVLMVIGNNLARAFGLVGALSIIRFRTAIKDTVDIVYIFLSLAIGMAGGVGYHKLAFIGTLVVGAILLLISTNKSTFFLNNQFMLQFIYSNVETDENSFVKVLSGYCSGYELINVHSNEIDKSHEYSYSIYMRKNKDSNQFLQDLQKVKGMKNISLFFDQQNV